MRSVCWLAVLAALGCVDQDNPYVCDGTDCDGGTDGGCTEAWACSYWQATDAGTAVRSCVDANACGTTASRPSQGPVALPGLDLNFYKCNVQPVLARSCAMAGCHGTLSPDRPMRVFARGRQRNHEIVAYSPSAYGCGGGATVNIDLAVEASGTSSCPAKIKLTATEWALNFDNNRTFAIGIAGPDSSELLVQPAAGTGFPHAGIKTWTPSSSEYQTVRAWLDGGTLATCNTGYN